ncbi:hypothetical protein V6V47_15285 [Micromonospora sp. CPCC 205539]|uniref:hypothetical protein n=1 Tax=Micromonospora sp. CPCC 205539 TaxID=3122408 RepID=UPI002FF36AA7
MSSAGRRADLPGRSTEVHGHPVLLAPIVTELVTQLAPRRVATIVRVAFTCESGRVGNADQLSRLLAIAALVVALLSFVVSVLTYRRAGAKIQVFLDIGSTGWGLTGFHPVCMNVRIRNEGLATVQIDSVNIAFEGIAHPSYNHHHLRGFQVPGKLEGHHSVTLYYPIAAALEFLTPAKLAGAPLQATVELGSGHRIKSKKRRARRSDVKYAIPEYKMVRKILDLEFAKMKKGLDEDFVRAMKELGWEPPQD